jgi:hypothetical protein
VAVAAPEPPADVATPPRQDFSKPSLIRLFSDIPEPPRHERKVKFTASGVDVEAFGTRWHLWYPFLPMMQGSFNTGRGMGSDFPDPFILTGTAIASGPRTWHDERAMSGELRRIERTERERARIKVKPE